MMHAMSTAATLTRETFRTSRLLDFCSERELVKQIGHSVDQWPLVILKESVDNAIDAAEEANTPPVIRVEVINGAIVITDNGPGIPAETVADILDFSVRVSSREAYASPTRGAQGNALKTIVAMAFALDGTKGETVIESHATAHRISFKVDQVRQKPKIDHIREGSSVRSGTRITVKWPVCALLKTGRRQGAVFTNGRGLRMAEPAPFALPHLGRRALRRIQGFPSGLGEMASLRSDFAALV
jgi:DNA topoisomerase VI subunit B